MSIRTRKLIGTALLLLLMIVYSVLAVSVAVVLQMQNANKAVELVYYALTGTLWIIPAGALIWWMQKPDQPAN